MVKEEILTDALKFHWENKEKMMAFPIQSDRV